jgi:hypothetical protein
VSLTLQSDTEAEAAAPSRRSLPDARTETDVAPASTIAPGWYADPMGSPRSRWWDGSAWTAELSVEAPAEPAAAVVNDAPAQGRPAFESAAVDVAAAEARAAPLSRRQLRELVGPLTTGPVLIDTAAEALIVPVPVEPAPIVGSSRAFEPVAAPLDTDAPSPFEALFASSLAARESAEAAVFGAAPFVESTDFTASSVARPWIGAAVPLVPAASAPAPVPVQSAPPVAVTRVTTARPKAMSAPPFSAGGFGFSLPPDPFATPSSALQATPPPFVSMPSIPVSPASAITARSTTAAVWILALLPAVHAALIWLLLGELDLGGDPLIRYSVLGAPLVLSLVLAFADRGVLRARGFDRTAPTVLAIVPVLYLLVRAIRVGVAGVAPLFTWLLLQAAAYFFILVQLPAVFALVPLTPLAEPAPVAVVSGPITEAQRAAELTPSGMATELTRQTLAKNLRFTSISCPTIPVTLDGTAVTCVGTIASVKMNLNVVIDSSLPNSAFALVSEVPAA